MEKRLNYLEDMLVSTSAGWPKTCILIDEEIEVLTTRLITQNDEQVRGAIKALEKLKGIRDELESERNHIIVALSEKDAT